jgi:hypothetical protein
MRGLHRWVEGLSGFPGVVVGFGVLSSVLVAPVYAGEETVDDLSDRITYDGGAWNVRADEHLLGGTEHVNNGVGARATLTYTGGSVTVVFSTGPDRAINTVDVDGFLTGTIDEYGPEVDQGVMTFAVGPGEHTITVTNSGGRNADSTGWATSIDAFIIDGAVDATESVPGE